MVRIRNRIAQARTSPTLSSNHDNSFYYNFCFFRTIGFLVRDQYMPRLGNVKVLYVNSLFQVNSLRPSTAGIAGISASHADYCAAPF